MSDYLEGYGVEDARRERLRKRALLSLLVIAFLGGVLWFVLRDRREKAQLATFYEALRSKRYEEAYRMWGCAKENPCRDYSFERFLEDWGPQSPHADLSGMKVVKTRSCRSGIIQTLDFNGKDELHLYVNRGDLVLSYSPWPICDPRIKPPTP